MTSLALHLAPTRPAPVFLPPISVFGARCAAPGDVLGALTEDAPTETDSRSSRFAPDAEQLRRIGNGDRLALGQAYDDHHEAVRACARRLVGDASAAEDLVHDAFVALPRAARRFRGQCSVRTLIISVALNHSRHYLRAAKRRRKAAERLTAEPLPAVRDPECEVSRYELARALVHALDSLPTDQRVAFVLCEVEERDSSEVAALVGAPAATVRTRVYHARRKLRRVLRTTRLS